ncbi:MAG: hypothetical protein M0Z67_10070 [Nitrospiraceae bacterium]|nr:hypothetical protein [Nitrospiraceae bacterium]
MKFCRMLLAFTAGFLCGGLLIMRLSAHVHETGQQVLSEMDSNYMEAITTKCPRYWANYKWTPLAEGGVKVTIDDRGGK